MAHLIPIHEKYAYEKLARHDGEGGRTYGDQRLPSVTRILDATKDKAKLDEWMKAVAPSDQIRKSFHAGTLSWGEFRTRYLSELKTHRDEVRRLADLAETGRVSLVFSATDEEHNNAVVLKQYLEMLGTGQ